MIERRKHRRSKCKVCKVDIYEQVAYNGNGRWLHDISHLDGRNLTHGWVGSGVYWRPDHEAIPTQIEGAPRL